MAKVLGGLVQPGMGVLLRRHLPLNKVLQWWGTACMPGCCGAEQNRMFGSACANQVSVCMSSLQQIPDAPPPPRAQLVAESMALVASTCFGGLVGHTQRQQVRCLLGCGFVGRACMAVAKINMRCLKAVVGTWRQYHAIICFSQVKVSSKGKTHEWKSAVQIEKCRFLEGSGCVGMCVSLCKVSSLGTRCLRGERRQLLQGCSQKTDAGCPLQTILGSIAPGHLLQLIGMLLLVPLTSQMPTQTFFLETVGLPLTLEPNFEGKRSVWDGINGSMFVTPIHPSQCHCPLSHRPIMHHDFW